MLPSVEAFQYRRGDYVDCCLDAVLLVALCRASYRIHWCLDFQKTSSGKRRRPLCTDYSCSAPVEPVTEFEYLVLGGSYTFTSVFNAAGQIAT